MLKSQSCPRFLTRPRPRLARNILNAKCLLNRAPVPQRHPHAPAHDRGASGRRRWTQRWMKIDNRAGEEYFTKNVKKIWRIEYIINFSIVDRSVRTRNGHGICGYGQGRKGCMGKGSNEKLYISWNSLKLYKTFSYSQSRIHSFLFIILQENLTIAFY